MKADHAMPFAAALMLLLPSVRGPRADPIPLRCSPASGQHGAPVAAADARGNLFAAWQVVRGAAGADLFLRAAPNSGTENLPLAVCAGAGDQLEPALAADGEGGVWMAWEEHRADAPSQIYVRHVSPAAKEYPAAIAVSPSAHSQLEPQVASDGEGGVWIAWVDHRESDLDVVLQHLSRRGVPDPASSRDGWRIGTGEGDQRAPRLAASQDGAAIVGWLDSGAGERVVLRAVRVLASGEVDRRWPAEGRVLSSGAADAEDATLVPDGAGGVFACWTETADDGGDVYARHLAAAGAPAEGWPEEAVAVCAAPGRQSLPVLGLDDDDVWLAWQDERDAGMERIYAGRLARHDGGVRSARLGLPIGGGSSPQQLPRLAVDGEGGVIVLWQESTVPFEPELRAARLLDTGVPDPAWPVEGFRLGNLVAGRSVLVPTAGNGAQAWWSSFDAVWSLRIGRHGPESMTPALGFAMPWPNPAGQTTTFRFSLPERQVVRLEVFDVGGRRVALLHDGPAEPGVHDVAWALRDRTGHRVSSGVYFARLQAGNRAFLRRVVTLH